MKKLHLTAGILISIFTFTSCAGPAVLDKDISAPDTTYPDIIPLETKKITLNPEKSLFSQLTYLTEKLESFQQTQPQVCRQISTFIEEDNHSYSIDLLDSEEVQKEIKNLFDNEESAQDFIDKLKELIKNNNVEVISELCATENNIYVTLANNYSNLLIATWTEEQSFVLSEPITGLMDFFYSFGPEVMGGKHLIRIGYGDAGSALWTFYLLDPATQKSELIEECVGSFVYDEETLDFTEEKFEFSCETEYRP